MSIGTCRSLVCHRDVEMAIACLGSLLRFTRDPLQVVLHEDGSLTQADVDRLQHRLPGTRIVFRRDADAEMNERLRNHPNCYRYRYTQPFALKLLDAPLLSAGDLAFCDSDVLFLRPFRGLFRWADADTAAIFMADCREAYSVRPWHVIGRNRVRLPSRINSGLYMLRQHAHDLDYIEWCLGRPEFRRVIIWVEQTCWAALGYRVGCRIWDPGQIEVMHAGLKFDEKVAVHFTGRVRGFLPAALRRMESVEDAQPPVVMRNVHPGECRATALARSQLRHQCGLFRHGMMTRVRKGLPTRGPSPRTTTVW